MRRVPSWVRPFAAAVLAAGALQVSRNARAQEVASAAAPEDVPAPAPQPAPPAASGPKAVTVRASGGVAFVSSGYYCGYYGTYYLFSGGCGAGYASAQPELNLDVDVWLRPGLGLSLGVSVLWGSYAPGVTGVPPTRIYSTSWEPHLDVLLGLFTSAVAVGRVRLGVSLSVAKLHGLNATAQDIHYTGVGAAARLGLGASFFPKSTVGIGVDAVLEFGGMGGHYVSTIQLLLGPELHF